jgi:small conductance mechanosensitive channel
MSVAPLTHAQTAESDNFVQFKEIQNEFDKIRQLNSSVDSVREWHRDGLNARIDKRGVVVIRRLNAIAPALLNEFEANSTQAIELIKLLDSHALFALQRIATLDKRIADERAPLPKFEQNAQADISRAFIEDLTSISKDYIESYIRQAQLRDAAGLAFQGMVDKATSRLYILNERLMGQIELDAMSLDELLARRTEEPLREDLQKALDLVQTKQTRNLHRLERVIEISEMLGIESAEQRSLLIQEQGQVGVEILQRDVFKKLWDGQFTKLSEGIARNGPDVLFRSLLFSFVVITAWVLSRLVRYPIKAIVNRERFALSFLLRDALITLSSVTVFILGVVVALATLGVSLGPIFAGLGVIGILVGLAVQDSLKNLAAGTMILVHRPYDVDDRVKIAGAEGTVKRMNMLATTIITYDNQMLVVPNAGIWGDTIYNYTANPVRRVDVKVNVSYAEDIDRVHAVLIDVLEQHEHVLPKPEPEVHVVGMEDSAIAFVVKPWVRTEHYWPTLWELNRIIKLRLDDEGIEIPFPQRVVTLRPNDNQSKILDTSAADAKTEI